MVRCSIPKLQVSIDVQMMGHLFLRSQMAGMGQDYEPS